jgi:hypothetical protein
MPVLFSRLTAPLQPTNKTTKRSRPAAGRVTFQQLMQRKKNVYSASDVVTANSFTTRAVGEVHAKTNRLPAIFFCG